MIEGLKELRVSATALDGFVYYANSQMTAHQYARRLCGLEPPSTSAEVGRAVHKWLENWAYSTEPLTGSFVVRMDSGAQYMIDTSAFKYSDTIPLPRPSIVEVPMVKRLSINGMRVRLSARIDGIQGDRMIEWKTTGRISLERYADAWQWRVYMVMTGHPTLDYHVFRVRTKPQENRTLVMLMEHASLSVNSYAGIAADVMGKLSEYVENVCLLCDAGYMQPVENYVAYKAGDRFSRPQFEYTGGENEEH